MFFQILTSWWRRRSRPQVASMHVQMYTRRGCHLCDDAWKLLDAARQRYDFKLDSIDVDADPELAKEFGEQVPVVVVDGKVRFRGIVNPVLLERLLCATAPTRRVSGG